MRRLRVLDFLRRVLLLSPLLLPCRWLLLILCHVRSVNRSVARKRRLIVTLLLRGRLVVMKLVRVILSLIILIRLGHLLLVVRQALPLRKLGTRLLLTLVLTRIALARHPVFPVLLMDPVWRLRLRCLIVLTKRTSRLPLRQAFRLVVSLRRPQVGPRRFYPVRRCGVTYIPGHLVRLTLLWHRLGDVYVCCPFVRGVRAVLLGLRLRRCVRPSLLTRPYGNVVISSLLLRLLLRRLMVLRCRNCLITGTSVLMELPETPLLYSLTISTLTMNTRRIAPRARLRVLRMLYVRSKC